MSDEVDQAVAIRELGLLHIVRYDPHWCRQVLMDTLNFRLPKVAGYEKKELGRGTVWQCPRCGSMWRYGFVVCDWISPYDVFKVCWYRLRWWHRKKGVI